MAASRNFSSSMDSDLAAGTRRTSFADIKTRVALICKDEESPAGSNEWRRRLALGGKIRLDESAGSILSALLPLIAC